MHHIGALVVDGSLVAGFGVQHSALVTLRAKARVRRVFGIEPLAWRSVESVCNIVYVLAATALWRHVNDVVWDVQGTAAGLLWALVALSWMWYWQLHLFEYDCGLAFGSTTFVARLAGQPMSRLVPWKCGSRRWIRFPVHTAFFGMFFLLPHMTADLLVLAIVLNVYNVIGSILYDKRLERLAGESYVAYQAVTGLILPPVYRAPRGATALAMPRPGHWRRPIMHLPGVVGGVGLAAVYYGVMGGAPLDARSALLAGASGVLGAVLVGVVVGRLARADTPDWDQQQTDLSTTVALAAALGVVLWAGTRWLVVGHPPPFAVYLPLWFIVQYLGHVMAFLSNRSYWSIANRSSGPTPVAEVRDVPATNTASV